MAYLKLKSYRTPGCIVVNTETILAVEPKVDEDQSTYTNIYVSSGRLEVVESLDYVFNMLNQNAQTITSMEAS
jgi:hypothetical protein